MSSVKNKPMCFRPSAELEKRIKAAAKREKRSNSQIIALAVEAGISNFEAPTSAAIQE
ncbi:hypothetical protein [Alteromonas sp. KUL106]|uniref:hypothetical protein n=1 Tax=Alteromonas sp. KUL106 TaxID=2480799 RepID=UPI0012E6D26B|nr:hypothetical protein [Alteromonas sp. KUL106]GFD68089.1 hypothetical protein KUL106_13520 [Alteromonas sp. KUL106]